MHPIDPVLAPPSDAGSRREVTRLRDLSTTQWTSGIAACLGWLFDGLEMHLFTLVAVPFVAELLQVAEQDPLTSRCSSWIQAAFLVGWAFGGGVFGRLGDRLGRSRTLVLTIVTYALFTGLSFFATRWWHLLILRFLAALGIGGEWAVGASLLSETWPRQWRPWVAAVLQSNVNVGIMLASLSYLLLAGYPYRCVFLVGVLPALLVLWVRRAVPEPDQWRLAKQAHSGRAPGLAELFRGSARRITLLTVTVCAMSLTAHWAFVFWYVQHLRQLPDLQDWSAAQRGHLVASAMTLVMITSIVGNFVAAAIARAVGYRKTIALMCMAYCAAMAAAYSVPRDHGPLLVWLAVIGACSGVFALFTMYLPPLFPTLLRTTGAGFCYNIGRLAAAAGTVVFGLLMQVTDYRVALFCTGFLFLPAAAVAMFLPELPDECASVAPVD